MRDLLFVLSLLALVGCPSGDDDDATGDDDDATGDDDDATADDDDATGDDDDATGDDDDATGDDDDATGDDDDATDADFLANGPGLGLFWDFPVIDVANACGVGNQYSLVLLGSPPALEVSAVVVADRTFMLQLTGSSWTPTLPCTYTDSGRFTCTAATAGYGTPFDAYVTEVLAIEGQFRSRVAPDPNTELDHTYGVRWSADMDMTFSRSCVGADCGAAASASGATGFPCATELTFETVNYDDPSLPPATDG